jgi:hypothetical protein
VRAGWTCQKKTAEPRWLEWLDTKMKRVVWRWLWVAGSLSCAAKPPAAPEADELAFYYSCAPVPKRADGCGGDCGCPPLLFEGADYGSRAVYPEGCIVCAKSGILPSRCVATEDSAFPGKWLEWQPLQPIEIQPPLPHGCWGAKD